MQPGVVGARRRRRHPGGRPAVHGRHRGPPGGRRRAGERQRPDRDGPSAGDAWPCCRPATSWSTTGRRCEPGQIRESNRTMLAGLLAEAAATSIDFGTVRDDEAELERVLRVAAGDVRRDRHERRRVRWATTTSSRPCSAGSPTMTWMQIAIKPAKPFAFGMLDGTPIFGLPGNPVSSLVSFELLARPALRRMMGHRRLARPQPGRRQPTTGSSRRPDGKVHLVRVNAAFGDDGRCHVTPVGAQGSHQLAATALADAHRDRARRRRGPARRRRRRRDTVGCCRRLDMAQRWEPTISSIRSAASSATCGSRSPTAATSAARTACRKRA